MDGKNKVLLYILIILFIIPIWLFRYPPLADYPNQLLAAQVLRNYNNPEFDYNKNFIIHLMPFYYSTTVTYFIAYALKPFSIYTSGKIVLSLYIILFPLSILYFLSAVGKEENYLLAFPFIYNNFFNKGNLAYILGCVIVFFALGAFLRKKRVLFLSLVILLYFTHLQPFLILFFIVVIISLMEKRKRDILLFIPAFLMLIFNLFTLPLHQAIENSSKILFTYLPFNVRIREFITTFFVFSTPAEVFVNALLLFLFLYLSIKIFKKNPKHLYLPLSLLILYLILPNAVYGFATAKRVILFIPLLLLPYFEIKRYSIIRPIIIGVSLISLINIFYSYHKIENSFFDYQKIIDVIPREAKIKAIYNPYDTYVGQMCPIRHFFAYYNIEKGGISQEFPPSFFILFIEKKYRSVNWDYIITWGKVKPPPGYKKLKEQGLCRLYKKLPDENEF